MKRRLAAGAMMLALVVNGCADGKHPVSPAPPPPVPPPPLSARVEGTLSVTSRLTATGGYEYTMQVHLTEHAGVAVTVTKLDLIVDDGDWGRWVTVSGPEAWSGDENRMAAHGTLTSKPLQLSDESPAFYSELAWASITYFDGTAPSRSRGLSVQAATPPQPGPPSNDRVTLKGTVSDARNTGTIPDALVEVLNGPDADRRTTTDQNGAFTLAALRTGRFEIRVSKNAYESRRSIYIIVDTAMDFKLWMNPTAASQVPVSDARTAFASVISAGEATATHGNGSFQSYGLPEDIRLRVSTPRSGVN